MSFRAHAFVDGAYLRTRSEKAGKPLVDPRAVAKLVAYSDEVSTWCASQHILQNTVLSRVTYYDATPGGAAIDARLLEYWGAIARLDDVDLGFATLRGGTVTLPARRRSVDTLISVDLLAGAIAKLFDVAVLIGGGAEFVPAVNEVRRRGVMVAVGAAADSSLSDELRGAADLCVEFDPAGLPGHFPPIPGTARRGSVGRPRAR